MKKILFFLFVLIIAFDCCALEITSREGLVLEKIFQTLIASSEGGYVIFGKKPMCIHGFKTQDFFSGENENHHASVCLKEGAEVLKKLLPLQAKNNIVINVYNQPDTLVKNMIHVLIVNKNLFLKVVEDNLSLFQYVLGPDVTPEKLLEKLLDPNESFNFVLKNDKALIGILLGYGVKNSLYVSRIENLEESLYALEKPPFQPNISKISEVPWTLRYILLTRNNFKDVPVLTPSFGFSSINQELTSLSQKIDVSSTKLSRDHPTFIFGRLKEDKETDEMIKELEKTQDRIKQLISSQTFLSEVLALVYPKELIQIISTANHEQFSSFENKQLSFLVSANIWNVLEDECPSFRKAFLIGMNDADSNSFKDMASDSLRFEKLRALIEAKKSLKTCDEYFAKLHLDTTLNPISVKKLYYKITQLGNGKAISSQAKIKVHYTIFSPDNKIIADTRTSGEPIQLDLAETISGFVWGVQGMKIGETREIFIHPTFAYGIYTTLEKGIYLKVLVSLIDIDHDGKEFVEPKALDLTEVLNMDLEKEYSEQAYKVGYAQGYATWSHYKKSHLYQLAEITKWISQFESGFQHHLESESAQKLLNSLHWNIYSQIETD